MKSLFMFSLAFLSVTSLALADPLTLTVHTDQTTKTVSTGIYGQFLEHIFNSVHGGLWGDQILNGTLELRPAFPRTRHAERSQSLPMTSELPGQRPPRSPADHSSRWSRPMPTAGIPRNWEFVGDADEVSMDRDNPFNAEVSARIAAKAGSNRSTGPGIRQQNIALKQGEKYTFSLYARGSGSCDRGILGWQRDRCSARPSRD